MFFDVIRYEELWNKKYRTEEEEREFKKLYHMDEYMSGLDGDDSPVEEFYDEQ